MNQTLHEFTQEFRQGRYQYPTRRKCIDYSPVWFCWLQGVEQMPEWCKACYHQLSTHITPEQKIEFICIDNLQEWIDVPQEIMELFKLGIMKPVAFSDIIRHMLLATYGGLWIDSAIFVTGSPFVNMITYDFYTVHFYDDASRNDDASRGKWINGFIYSNGPNMLSLYCYNALLYLWNQHSVIIDYLQLDYIIWTAYNAIPEITRMIDDVPINNEHIRLLNDRLNNEYDNKIVQQIFA